MTTEHSPKEIIIPGRSLVVLAGPAGCGKSTFATKHFNRRAVVSSDECRALICDNETDQSVSGHAFEVMQLIIEKRLLLSRLTVADATHLERIHRAKMTSTGRRFGFRTAAIVFNVALETCLRRNAGRDRLVPEEAVRQQYARLKETLAGIDDEDFDSVFVLDENSQNAINVKVV